MTEARLSQAGVLLVGSRRVLAFDRQGHLRGDRRLDGPPTGLLVDQEGRVLVATPRRVEILSRDLELLHRLPTGYSPDRFGLMDDGSVVTAGSVPGGPRCLQLFGPDGQERLKRTDVRPLSVAFDGHSLCYQKEGGRTTYLYDPETGRSDYLSSGVTRLTALPGGGYLALSRGGERLEIHRKGQTRRYSFGRDEKLESLASLAKDDYLAFCRRSDGSGRAYRLAGRRAEAVAEIPSQGEFLVLAGGGTLVVSSEGAILQRNKSTEEFSSVQELVEQQPELLGQAVVPDSFDTGKAAGWSLAERLDYWARWRRVPLHLPVPSCRRDLPELDERDRVASTIGLAGPDKVLKRDLKVKGESHQLIGSFDGRIDWVTPSTVHRFQTGEAPLVFQVSQDSVLVRGREGGFLEVSPGQPLDPQQEMVPDWQLDPDRLVIGDVELPVQN